MADRIESAQWIAQQAAAVAESRFRMRGIPGEAIPALLEEYAKDPTGRERYERIAEEYCDKEAARRQKSGAWWQRIE